MLTTLYRYFNETGRLLYVGVTKNPFDRQSYHSLNQPWWGEVCKATYQHFDSRETALSQETRAIGSELPKYNKQGPVLGEDSKLHLIDLIANAFDDEWHVRMGGSISSIMSDLKEFSKKPEVHKLLFAFGESIPWDADGQEMLIDCLHCQKIVESPWFKKQFYNLHSEICDEA